MSTLELGFVTAVSRFADDGAATGLTVSACFPLWYLALARIGPLPAGMLTNLELPITMIAAYLLAVEIMRIPRGRRGWHDFDCCFCYAKCFHMGSIRQKS